MIENHSNRDLTKGPIVLWSTTFFVMTIGTSIYAHSNQINKLIYQENVQASISELGKRYIQNGTLNKEELEMFALGIRKNLNIDDQKTEGWYLLGQLYFKLGYTRESVLAYEKALVLAPTNKFAQMGLSENLLTLGDSDSVAYALEILDVLISKEPNNLFTLEMRAIGFSLSGNYQKAIASWLKLSSLLSQDDPSSKLIAQRIMELQSMVQENIKVVINVSQKIQTSLPEEGFLFVAIRETQTPEAAPILVKKVILDSFPHELKLSSTDSMTGNVDLSQLKSFSVSASISKLSDVKQSMFKSTKYVTYDADNTGAIEIIIDS